MNYEYTWAAFRSDISACISNILLNDYGANYGLYTVTPTLALYNVIGQSRNLSSRITSGSVNASESHVQRRKVSDGTLSQF